MAELTKISELHPTQLTIGMREVERRAATVGALPKKKQADYVEERSVPCVAGPKGQLYLIDRHHMCRALLSAGLKEVRVEIRADARHLASDEFWVYMDLHNWVHPFDSKGVRQPIKSLSTGIGDLTDDPYRGLAGFLRRDKGFSKADMPFEEFIWADFLRRRVPQALLDKDYDTAQHKALELAHSDEARHMPGWSKGKMTT